MSKIETYFKQRWEVLKETKLFRSEVEKIRAKWKIPINGFANDAEEIEWRDYFSRLDADYFIYRVLSYSMPSGSDSCSPRYRTLAIFAG